MSQDLKQAEFVSPLRTTTKRCHYKADCNNGMRCRFGHTAEEIEGFKEYARERRQRIRELYKTKQCVYARAGQTCPKERCTFYHDPAKARCLHCNDWAGHPTDECPNYVSV